ncbi:hypothetical protein CC79DRAFT_1331377 [Sarocladium strictum]
MNRSLTVSRRIAQGAQRFQPSEPQEVRQGQQQPERRLGQAVRLPLQQGSQERCRQGCLRAAQGPLWQHQARQEGRRTEEGCCPQEGRPCEEGSHRHRKEARCRYHQEACCCRRQEGCSQEGRRAEEGCRHQEGPCR